MSKARDISNIASGTNTAVGEDALENNTVGNNTAVGYQALFDNTTAERNTAVGRLAAANTTTGADNTVMGSAALTTNTTGANNIAIGASALRLNTTASNNTAVGFEAGYNLTTGTNVVAIGKGAGRAASSQGYACYVGSNAGLNTTGSENQFFGKEAGYHVTTGSKNTILGGYNGNQGGLDIRTSNNNIVLSDGDGNPRLHYNNTYSAWQVYGSDGYLRFSGDQDQSVSLTNGSTDSILGNLNGACLVCVYETSTGSGALYFSNYAGVTVILSQAGTYSFGTSAGAANINLYKSNPGHPLDLQNLTGVTKSFNVSVFGATALG